MFDNFKKYKLVPWRDQSEVKLIRPNFETGPWIAGGAILQWLDGRSLGYHDLDVFVKNQSQFDALSDTLSKSGYHLKHESKNACTYRSNDVNSHKFIQLIKQPFESVDALINRFDFSICAVATDGNNLIKHPQFDEDYKNKVLQLINPLRDDCIKRLIKYQVYGYQPTDELLDELYTKKEKIITDYSDSEPYGFEEI